MVLCTSYTVPKIKKNHSGTHQAFVNVDWQISSVSMSLAGVQMWRASRKEKQGARQSPTSSAYAGGGHRPIPSPHPFWLIFFWSPHLQAVIITGPYRGAVASGFILARDTTPPLVAVSRPLWVHELGVQSLEKLKLFNSARSQILLNVSSRIFFLQEITKFLRLKSMTTSCKYNMLLFCLQFCETGTGDAEALNCAHNSRKGNE